MSFNEAFGFGYQVLAVGVFTAGLLIFAGFGFVMAWRCFCRGADLNKNDISYGEIADNIIKNMEKRNG